MKAYLFILLASLYFCTPACKQSNAGKKKDTKEQVAVVYTCPMHPEVKSDKAGKCPKCGMTLVKATEDDSAHPDSSSNTDDEID
jgi:hypothetical protein